MPDCPEPPLTPPDPEDEPDDPGAYEDHLYELECDRRMMAEVEPDA